MSFVTMQLNLETMVLSKIIQCLSYIFIVYIYCIYMSNLESEMEVNKSIKCKMMEKNRKVYIFQYTQNKKAYQNRKQMHDCLGEKEQ